VPFSSFEPSGDINRITTTTGTTHESHPPHPCGPPTAAAREHVVGRKNDKMLHIFRYGCCNNGSRQRQSRLTQKMQQDKEKVKETEELERYYLTTGEGLATVYWCADLPAATYPTSPRERKRTRSQSTKLTNQKTGRYVLSLLCFMQRKQ